ncbi:MAG: crotonase/enoyl-CoA hydratase family protein [Actinomycetota bacterium]|nr:crotonase/enoyl-CoA hydratase family protein [Actinomycetota bacterium]
MPVSGYVTCSVTDAVAQVRLSRPDKLNALTLDTIAELVAIAHGLRGDRSLRAVVLSGEGSSFCAGLDFGSTADEHLAVLRTFLPRPWRGTNNFQEACWAWRRLPVPVIAAVHGHCFGGGLQIALAADFRIATPESQWSVMEGRWGLVPDMTGIATLKELVGIDTAKRLTMTAQRISGKEAHALGLVTELDADPVAAAESFARELCTASPDAIAAAKRLFNTTWTAHPRITFARERFEQAYLLFTANTKAARRAAVARAVPSYGPRGRR